MPNVLITPLMGLPNPVPGVDPGPDYADNIQNCFDIIDGHNHSVGSGNQIGPSGININSDLPFNGNNATVLRSVRFFPQGSPISDPSDLGCLYESGVDLYYNDGNGNQVRITSGGSVNATSSGISSGTATASFSGGVLVVDSNTNTPGNIQCGSVLIGTNTVSPNFVTISSPNALASNYSLVAPAALPGARSFLTLDNSGNIATGVAYANGITASQIANGTITGTQAASNINLPGKAVQESGNNVVVSNTNATNSLSVIRGWVSSSGTILSGEGFTVAHNTTGDFTVSFSTSFGDIPGVSVICRTVGSAMMLAAFNADPSASAFEIKITALNGTATDTAFAFIAMGQRS